MNPEEVKNLQRNEDMLLNIFLCDKDVEPIQKELNKQLQEVKDLSSKRHLCQSSDFYRIKYIIENRAPTDV